MYGLDRPREHNLLYREQLLGARLLARMAPSIQLWIVRYLYNPLGGARGSRSYQHPYIHVRRAMA